MKSILDPTFKYTPAHATDIRKTFERVRRQQAQKRGWHANHADWVRQLTEGVKSGPT
jgi:uncharacterized protein YecE (DUF72 family)